MRMSGGPWVDDINDREGVRGIGSEVVRHGE